MNYFHSRSLRTWNKITAPIYHGCAQIWSSPDHRRIAWQLSQAFAEVCLVEMTSRNTTRGWGVGIGAWEHRDQAFPARCRSRFGNLIWNLTRERRRTQWGYFHFCIWAFVCQHNNSKSCQRIFVKFFGEVGCILATPHLVMILFTIRIREDLKEFYHCGMGLSYEFCVISAALSKVFDLWVLLIDPFLVM